jgi:hypothetical protein
MVIDCNGNVGIGTASPHKTLEVFNGAATVVDAIFGNNSGALAIVLNNNVGCIYGYTSTAATVGASMALQPSGGYVGIGTTAPAATLHVIGNAIVSGFIQGPSASLTAPIYTCPAYTTTHPALSPNQMCITYNLSGNYVTLWVCRSDGVVQIASMTMTTPS